MYLGRIFITDYHFKTLRTHTQISYLPLPSHFSDMVGMNIFRDSIQLDVECFAYYAYKTPEAIMDSTVISQIRESYANVLRTIEEHCVVSLLSGATYDNYADWVHGGEDALQQVYQANPSRFVSAEMTQSLMQPPKLIPGVHPCTFYNKMKNNPLTLLSRADQNDNIATNYKRRFTGNELAVCTYHNDMHDPNSAAFKAAYAAALKSSKLGYKNAVLEVFDENQRECLKYCKKNFPDEVKALEDITYEHKKSFFGSRGYNAAVTNTFEKNQDACLDYVREHYPDIENIDQITYEHMKSFFGSRGYNAAVVKNFEKNQDACLDYVREHYPDIENIDQITYEHMKSFFGSRGYNGAVTNTCEKNQDACLEYCKDNFPDEVKSFEDITFEHMKSFFGSRGYNGAVMKHFEENQEKYLSHFEDKNLEDITFEDMKSFFGSEGYNASVMAKYDKDPQACLEWCRKNFPDKVRKDADLTFEQMSSFYGFERGKKAKESVAKKEDPDGALRDFGYTNDQISGYHSRKVYDVKQLAHYAPKYKKLLDDAEGVGAEMPMSTFIDITMSFVERAYARGLPNGWAMPTTIEFCNSNADEVDITLHNNINKKLNLAVEPKKAIKTVRHLGALILFQMEQHGISRFQLTTKTTDSNGGEASQFNLAYLILNKALLQRQEALAAKLYNCPDGCLILIDTIHNGRQKRCPSEKKGGCGKLHSQWTLLEE